MIAPARTCAYEVLRRVLSGRDDLPAAVARARARLADPRDQALVAEIATGTLRHLAALDHIIARLTQRPTAHLDPEVLDILRLSAYQILHLSRVPAPAVVDDAVALTRRVGRGAASGFVNAVLRGLVRVRDAPGLPPPPRLERADRPAGSAREAALDYLAITLSHPRWLVARWLDRYGFEATAAWAAFNNEPAPLVLCPNRRRISRDDLGVRLAEYGIAARPGRYAPDALIVTAGHPLRTPLVEMGLFVVQDEASQLVTLLAGVGPGDQVLDACAAPGGKTIGLAADQRGTGQLVAADLRPRRVRLLRQSLDRAGVTDASVVRIDLRAGLPFRRVFHRVLVDAPCSGLGTIRRDPDIRWRRSAADLPGFAAVQFCMLDHAADGVIDGGSLVYATCSSEPEENDLVVARFLDTHPDYVRQDPRDVTPAPPAGLVAVLDPDGQLRTLPHVHGLEAFYGARLVRRR